MNPENPLFRTAGALDPNHIAATIARRILTFRTDEKLKKRLQEMEIPHGLFTVAYRKNQWLGCRTFVPVVLTIRPR